MLRSILLKFLNWVPQPIKQSLKKYDSVGRIYRRVFHALVGREGEVVAIRSGPLSGIKLVLGPPVTHAQINGVYEPDVSAAIDRLVQAHFVSYDLGASTGYHSLLMARKCKQVYAFEPTPHEADWIKTYAKANEFQNIEVIPAPVSDQEKLVTFAFTELGYGSRIVNPEVEDKRWKRVQFQAITLDQFAASHAAPDFIKIDIEGEEGRALEGARRILQEKRPLICCEIHSLECARHVVSILNEFGYRITRLDDTPFEMPKDIHPGDFHVLAFPE